MSKKKKEKLALRLVNSGLQMGVIIFLGTFGGDYLDEINQNKTPVYTIIGSLLGVFIGLYILYKNIIKISK
jgi:F0F1-type ATP synthase assembly protein I